MLHREKVEVEFAQIYKTVGLGTTIWSPLASGVLTGKYNTSKTPKNTRLNMQGLEWLKEKTLTKENIKKVEKLKPIAEGLNMSLPQLALCWCLNNPNVSSVILGASKLAQLKENIKATTLKDRLNDTVLEKIEKVLKNKPLPPAF
jgi:aryl-alcohol dehydrogenase-like predicted oxidoreductase